MKITRISPNFYGIWLWLMLFLSAGSFVYYFYALNWIGIIASLIIASLLYYGLHPLAGQTSFKEETNTGNHKIGSAAGLISIALSTLAIIIAFQAQTDKAIITPWTEVSPWYFVTIGLSSLTLITALLNHSKRAFKILTMAVYLLSIFSVAAIVYRLGYGFDPFIHQAAMKEISRYGFILPKTPYYLGQYSLVAVLDKIGVSVFYVNRWLLPALAALSLPFLLSSLHRGRKDKRSAWLASLALLFLSFSPLIMTTPQNFSYLLLLATVILLYKKAPWPLSIATALAAFAVHPLAGIPAIFLSLWILAPKAFPKVERWRIYNKPLYIMLAAVAIFSLSIWAVAGFGHLQLRSFNLSILTPIFTNQETYILDLSYFLIKNHFWFLLAGAATIFFWRHRLWSLAESNSFKTAKVLALSATAALTAYLISRGFHIEGLIAYEQDDYAARLPIIALIMIVPLFWELFYQGVRRILLLPRLTRIIAGIGFSLLLLVTVYGSYPRFDNYHNSRGYSTGMADVVAVWNAEKRAGGEKYIVLANQQVSAAALREFGFRERYLHNDGKEMYFYPIPTGGRLYQFFLDMVYIKADAETMKQAMDAAGVNRAFLIINRYWWASDKIIAEAKLNADSWERLNQGEIHIFEYKR